MAPNYKQYSVLVFKLQELLPGMLTWLIHLGGRGCQYGRGWNLHYKLCARTHLSLWPRGSYHQRPRGCSCLCVHAFVCVWVIVCLHSCEYNRKWCSGLLGHGSRSLGLSSVISSRMVITYCKNKHHYLLVLRLCTVTYTPRKALDHQNTQGWEQKQSGRCQVFFFYILCMVWKTLIWHA